MSSGNSSTFSMPQNQEKKQIPRYEVCVTNKNLPFMWLVCKTRAKILLSEPETLLTTPRLLPSRRSRRSYRNYLSPQLSGSFRNILKRLGRSGRSGRAYGNQALVLQFASKFVRELKLLIFRSSYILPLPIKISFSF